MACSISVQTLLFSPKIHYPYTASFSPSFPILFLENSNKYWSYLKLRNGKREIRAMVQQTVQGPSAAYAKEMERLSAKESLLLAFKDAGGFEALVAGKTTDVQRIDVNERIVNLERLNPTPRPTTSPFLEGRWNFEWFGSGSPGLFAAQFLFERFPSGLANLSKLDVVIKDGYAKIAAIVKLLNSIESKIVVSTRLTVEGPLRMKEEYIEGIFESPKVNEESIPQQLKGALGQAATTLQQLPVPIRDAVSGGLKVPLGGMFERLFMISYLDDEILGSTRKINFCQWCGGPTKHEIPDGEEKTRAICTHCGKIAYENPKMVVGCLIQHENKILLCKRKIQPSYGLWTLPAGYMEIGESAAEGATRETWEEANAEVEILSPFAHLDIPLIGQTYIIFLAKLKKPHFSPGPESLECKLFAPEDIPFDSLSFSSMLVTLKLYIEDKKIGRPKFHYGIINKRPGTSPSEINAYTLDQHIIY